MNSIRYFKEGSAYWKFEDGRLPKIKTPILTDWAESIFTSIEDFLAVGGSVEVSAEEAEAGRTGLRFNPPAGVTCLQPPFPPI